MQEVFAIPVVDEIRNGNNDENKDISSNENLEVDDDIINDPEINTNNFGDDEEDFNIDKINKLFSSKEIA